MEKYKYCGKEYVKNEYLNMIPEGLKEILRYDKYFKIEFFLLTISKYNYILNGRILLN